MTAERFFILAETYGADFARWPAAERAAAAAFAEAHPQLVERGLLTERRLDAQLDAYAVAPPAGLRAKVLASAPLARAAGRAWRWFGAAGLGLGLAASCAAGVAAGLTLAPASVTRLFEDPASTSASDGGDTALADPAGDAGPG